MNNLIQLNGGGGHDHHQDIHVNSIIKKILQSIVPFTSILTVLAVGYVVSVYEYKFIPLLKTLVEEGVEFPAVGDGILGVQITEGIFLFFPFMIFWTLIAILCYDEGHMKPKMINKLYEDN